MQLSLVTDPLEAELLALPGAEWGMPEPVEHRNGYESPHSTVLVSCHALKPRSRGVGLLCKVSCHRKIISGGVFSKPQETFWLPAMTLLVTCS